MMKAQARNYAAEFRRLGFQDVNYTRCPVDPRGFYVSGYVLTGNAEIDGKLLPFEIRSPRMAREFAYRYGKKVPS